MKSYVIKITKIILAIAIFGWFGIFLAHKIDLTTADLGRHIQNGNIILHGSWHEKWAVLHTNFYSYTLPNQPFVNHHWLSGVVFYLIFVLSGFVGLSAFYVLLGLPTLWLFFDVARKASNFWIASGTTLILTPLLASRAEVRPEMFTYFFTGVFFWIIWRWRADESADYRLLLVLPALMLLWVNLHIGFVFGFLVPGAFLFEAIIHRTKNNGRNFMSYVKDVRIRQLLIIITGCVLLGLINPFGYKILIYPFLIFKNYGYLIVENQSIRFLENLQFTQGQHFLLFKLIAGAAGLLFIIGAIKNWRKFDLALFILVLVTAIMAYFGIRNFPSFAFFVLPALAAGIYQLIPQKLHPAYLLALGMCLAGISGYAFFNQRQDYLALKPALGLGLLPGAQDSANFFKNNKIPGPIFNDYDIGSYLDFNLYPQKVFVDNRPEAYTPDFFQNVYEAAQNEDSKWQSLDSQYHFNTIFFSYRDYTPWAQKFLITRVNDPAWVPVFVDSYNIIFLRLNQGNLPIIRENRIPKSSFQEVGQ